MTQTQLNRAARLTLQDARAENVPATAELGWLHAAACGRVTELRSGRVPAAWLRAWAWVLQCEETAQ